MMMPIVHADASIARIRFINALRWRAVYAFGTRQDKPDAADMLSFASLDLLD
jgi:hypothetical protein